MPQNQKSSTNFKDLWSALDFIYDHVIITDAQEKILYANSAVERITGFKAEECIGKKPNELWGGHMPKEFYERMRKTIYDEKKPFIEDVKNIRKDGIEYEQELYIAPILNNKGEIEFFISIEPLIRNKSQEVLLKQKFIAHLLKQQTSPIDTLLDIGEIIEEKNMRG